MMNILEDAGQNLILQAEGNRQLASALADGFRMLGRHVARLLGTARPNVRGKHQCLR